MAQAVDMEMRVRIEESLVLLFNLPACYRLKGCCRRPCPATCAYEGEACVRRSQLGLRGVGGWQVGGNRL